MDSKGRDGARKHKGDLTEDKRTEHSEKNPVTKIKQQENRKPERKTNDE
jgi:hypothetical protein